MLRRPRFPNDLLKWRHWIASSGLCFLSLRLHHCTRLRKKISWAKFSRYYL